MTTETDIVKLIDEKARFDAIPTGYKTWAGLKNHTNQVAFKHYKVMFRKYKDALKLKDMSNVLWVAKHKDMILADIKANDKHKPATKRVYMEALA